MRVFFLGAGSSKAMGLPLTSELLPKIIEFAQSDQLFVGHQNASDKRKELLGVIADFVPRVHKASLPSIVDLLSLIDFSLAEGFTVLQRGGADRLRRSRALLEAGLLDVLAQHTSSRSKLSRLENLLSTSETCIVTTNYDFIPDLAMRSYFTKEKENVVDYGMPWRDTKTGAIWQRPTTPETRLFKLHGSVNWLGCPFCEYIYIHQQANIARLDTDSDNNQFGDATTCHCGYAPLRRVIVSPSLSRGSYQTQLRSIHLAALEALRTAEEIYIVGYSLPMEDLLVRSLFLRAISHQAPKAKLQVFQISEAEKPCYDMLFENYDYFTSGFDGFIAVLENQPDA